MIPNRVDLAVFGPPKRDYSLNVRPKFVSVGSFVNRKNHVRLIESLFAAVPDAELTLVGSGPLANEYLKLSGNLGVSDRLHLVHASSHQEVARVLGESDIYVHSALSEGVPRAVLEAMAMGLPVVSTSVGFIGGILTHDHDVLLIGDPSTEEMGAALSLLAGNEEERSRLGTAARETIKRSFEWNVVFDQYRHAIYAPSRH